MRLTGAELATGRGFCATCGAEFDIAVGQLENGWKSQETLSIALTTVGAPPGIQQTGDNSLRISAPPWGWVKRWGYLWLPLAAPLVAAGRLLSVVSGRGRAHDEVEVRPLDLVVRKRRALRATERALLRAEIATVTVNRHESERLIVITTRDRHELAIADSLGHPESSLIWAVEWMRGQLEHGHASSAYR